jgi:hypothetical protein
MRIRVFRVGLDLLWGGYGGEKLVIPPIYFEEQLSYTMGA